MYRALSDSDRKKKNDSKVCSQEISQDEFEALLQYHAQGLLDFEIAQILSLDEDTVTAILRGLGMRYF
ncbi:hypothetical protein SAMN02745945_00941 [Peptoclostridium litorale DSM 5388]|uniref:HTH luxR-type domain-containing protein n=1 Tax=Peptoclostridium litorale DSM 5388 TaxID=1121324 RepID=A0A069RAC3_PEPLI|nr:hypothetical protein [Peptoclostridium litorale]KDR93748.1 hypothetical protein CLIT_23c00200 [Peptoclostridium litorale DSM 5388]SIN85077.1 hypothetical protein SAMN02745945_00941 [Peptoclostridium litorale DSM 5388]